MDWMAICGRDGGRRVQGGSACVGVVCGGNWQGPLLEMKICLGHRGPIFPGDNKANKM